MLSLSSTPDLSTFLVGAFPIAITVIFLYIYQKKVLELELKECRADLLKESLAREREAQVASMQKEIEELRERGLAVTKQKEEAEGWLLRRGFEALEREAILGREKDDLRKALDAARASHESQMEQFRANFEAMRKDDRDRILQLTDKLSECHHLLAARNRGSLWDIPSIPWTMGPTMSQSYSKPITVPSGLTYYSEPSTMPPPTMAPMQIREQSPPVVTVIQSPPSHRHSRTSYRSRSRSPPRTFQVGQHIHRSRSRSSERPRTHISSSVARPSEYATARSPSSSRGRSSRRPPPTPPSTGNPPGIAAAY